MQDDQDQITKSIDSLTKSDGQSNGSLSLSGSPSASQDDQKPDPQVQSPPEEPSTDPAQEALAKNQAEQPADTAPATAENETSAPDITPPSEISTGSVATSSSSDEALDPIKKDALQKLEPLVGELDLNPEEKYRALMMIIQATDNKELVNEAYQAADKIEDNKTRAQALLSIINEIDYFKSKESATG